MRNTINATSQPNGCVHCVNPAPRSRDSIPAGVGEGQWIWGIDPAIAHVSFAFAAIADESIVVESLITQTDATEGERLGLLDRQIRIYARQIAGTYPPDVVWVEQPSGSFENQQLAYAVGVIQAAVFETLRCPVWTIPSGKWKKRALGYGNASKEQVAAWVADHLRIDVSSQDEADAAAIAHAGRIIYETREWAA